MKRLFVRPKYRGLGLGRLLAMELVARGRSAGYEAMRLDTLPGEMGAAVGLYRSLGFQPIAPYNVTPIDGVLHMELGL